MGSEFEVSGGFGNYQKSLLEFAAFVGMGLRVHKGAF